MRTYEAMFLMEPTLATDWPAAEAEVNRLLQRADAKVLGVKDWGERKLAYPIGQWKRGLYVLSYFEAGPESASALERDVHLSEKTIRVLVTRRDKMTPEAVEQALLAEPPSKTPARGDEWGGRWDARPPRRDRNIVKPAPQDADQATATPSKEEGARKDPEQAAPDAEKVPDEKKDTPA